MANLTLRRFSKLEMIAAIHPRHLRVFLAPYTGYLEQRGVQLPAGDESLAFPYGAIAQLLMTPDAAMPGEMVEALYYIHEMATPQGHDAMIEALEETGLELESDERATALDLAMQIWLKAPRLLERLHAEQNLFRPRSFEYYRSAEGPLPGSIEPDEEARRRLEADLDRWFVRKRRGRTAQVHIYNQSDSVWFLVRHGEPYKFENVIKEGESGCIFFRPEKFDVIVFEPQTGEIRINARTKGERELYRTMLGQHLFGDPEFFGERSRFILEPLARDGQAALVCRDIAGLEWVKLKEVHLFWGGLHGEVEIRKADDLFDALAMRGNSLPRHVRMTKACFAVKFVHAKVPRTVTISSSNRAQYKRDDDGGIIEQWMRRRGFISFGEGSGGAEAEIVEMY